MKLAIDLALAVATTLAFFLGGMLAIDDRSFLVVVVLATVAGVAVLVVRRRQNDVIPIASVFLVLMFGVLLWLGFVIAWYQGRVEF